MRALFLEVLLDIAKQNGLGIAFDCLYLFIDRIDSVIAERGEELRNRAAFAQAYSELQEFVQRMVQDAAKKGYKELHEDTYGEALAKCGLIWWCRRTGRRS